MVTVQFQTDADNNDFGWRLIWGEENFIFDKKKSLLFRIGEGRMEEERSFDVSQFPETLPHQFQQ